ncbi:hypothetical protein [Mastigocoleus sp. MO_188.B34]|uniref:hypothetical protein n=1 Tax=Mastigocoleus sp. MO_188.B34 TaxID=3036635 RepID=UPI0026206F8E|nr:hypothetical protein [Mastigocoleus sp. MO_188.B34]MDJ0692824.1 hypothetical protein [Mastigocoleus sp. MO_188.B34]
MKEVLALIEKRKQEFAQLPFFKYLQDTSVDPRQRLAWAPCAAPFAMGFGDLNKYVFRKEPAENKIQEIINKHTYEDDYHWEWFVEDIEKLEFDRNINFSDALRFLWGEETQKSRQICLQIAQYTLQADSIVTLAAIQAIEGTWHTALPFTMALAQEVQQNTDIKYSYFGRNHADAEIGHTICQAEMQEFIKNIQLTEEQKIKAFAVVEKVFDLFSESVQEMMIYAQKHPIEQILQTV